jgi:hypothetical protein
MKGPRDEELRPARHHPHPDRALCRDLRRRIARRLHLRRGRRRCRERRHVEAALTGVFDLTKIGSQAWTVGAKVYWDDTNKRCTTVATDNTLIGVAVDAVAGGAGDTIGRVRLNGSF